MNINNEYKYNISISQFERQAKRLEDTMIQMLLQYATMLQNNYTTSFKIVF